MRKNNSKGVVCVIDDSPEMTGLIVQTLEDANIEVQVCQSLREAIAAKPGAIVTDSRVPAIAIHELEDTKSSVPVVFLAPHDLTHTPAFVRVLRKPFQLTALIDIVLGAFQDSGVLHDYSCNMQDPV